MICRCGVSPVNLPFPPHLYPNRGRMTKAVREFVMLSVMLGPVQKSNFRNRQIKVLSETSVLVTGGPLLFFSPHSLGGGGGPF